MISRLSAEHEFLQDLMSWWNNGRVMRSVGFPDGLDLTIYDMIILFEKWKLDNTSFRFIVLLKNGTPIGETSYLDHDTERNQIEIGLRYANPICGDKDTVLKPLRSWRIMPLNIRVWSALFLIHLNPIPGLSMLMKSAAIEQLVKKKLLMELKKCNWFLNEIESESIIH